MRYLSNRVCVAIFISILSLACDFAVEAQITFNYDSSGAVSSWTSTKGVNYIEEYLADPCYGGAEGTVWNEYYSGCPTSGGGLRFGGGIDCAAAPILMVYYCDGSGPDTVMPPTSFPGSATGGGAPPAQPTNFVAAVAVTNTCGSVAIYFVLETRADHTTALFVGQTLIPFAGYIQNITDTQPFTTEIGHTLLGEPNPVDDGPGAGGIAVKNAPGSIPPMGTNNGVAAPPSATPTGPAVAGGSGAPSSTNTPTQATAANNLQNTVLDADNNAAKEVGAITNAGNEDAPWTNGLTLNQWQNAGAAWTNSGYGSFGAMGTNAGMATSNAITSALWNGSGALTGPPSGGSGTNGPDNVGGTIYLGSITSTVGSVTAFNLDLHLNTGGYIDTGWCATTRSVIYALAVFIFFVETLQVLRESIYGVINQRQAEGNRQEGLSFNADAPSGIAFAIIITAVMVTVVTLFITQAVTGAIAFTFAGFGASPTGGNSPWAAVATVVAFLTNAADHVPSWEVLTAMLPIMELFTLTICQVLWQNFLVWPSFVMTRNMILWLIS